MIRTPLHALATAVVCATSIGCTSLPHSNATPPPACPPAAWQGVLMADLTQPATSRTYLFPDGVTTCTVDLASP